MSATSEDVKTSIAAAHAALARGDQSKAEHFFWASINAAENVTGAERELAGALNALAVLRRDLNQYQEAEVLFRRSLAVIEMLPQPDESMLFVALAGLGGVRASRGALQEAESHLVRALAVGESLFGADHLDLCGLLGDLSRVFLRRAAYANAEPLLLRLYELKRRSKGDEHPEVATVLAMLATVHEALGHHDEAESMWRSVLTIRERTLAPSHYATATAVEGLAQACAARGKLAEALQLFRRATTMREITLGPSHPSVRATRDRIADLELQASDDTFAELKAGQQHASAPWEQGQDARDSYRPFSPTSATAFVDRPSPSSHAPVPSASEGAASVPEVVGSRAPDKLPDLTLPTDRDQPFPFDAIARHAEEQDEEQDDEREEESDHEGRNAGVIGALKKAFLSRGNQRNVVVGMIVAILLLGPLAMRSRGSLQADSPLADAALVHETPNVSQISDGRTDPTAPASATLATASVPGASLPSKSSATPIHAVPPKAEPPRRQVATRERDVPLVAPTVRKLSLGVIDSIAGALKGTGVESVVDAARRATDEPQRTFDVSVDAPSELVRAQLIGPPPQLRFPEILRDRKIEGDVIVRFIVDAQGRPDPASIRVIRAPHELLGAVVVRAIPALRFEPAHRATIGARAEADEIQMSFQFSSGVK